MRYLLPRRHCRGVDARVLVDRQRPVGCVRRGDEPQPSLLLGGGKRTLFVARLQALAVRQKPDLIKVHRLVARGIELAVLDAGAGAHALPFAGAQHLAAAEGVAMRQGAFARAARDAHGPTGMGSYTLCGVSSTL